MWRTSPDLPKGPSAGSRQDGCSSEDLFGSKVNTGTHQEVSSDQHSAGAGPELPHDHVTLLLVHVAVLPGMGGEEFCERVSHGGAEHKSGVEAPTRAETVKSRACIFSVSQSTFLLVLRKMTAWVMVSVSYRSHRVSSFHSWRQEDKACKAEVKGVTAVGVM